MDNSKASNFQQTKDQWPLSDLNLERTYSKLSQIFLHFLKVTCRRKSLRALTQKQS